MKVFVTDENHLKLNQISNNPLLNTWIKSYNNKNIINIKKANEEYIIYSNDKYKIIKTKEEKENIINSLSIKINEKYCILDIEENKTLYLYFLENIDKDFMKLKLEDGIEEFSIGGKYFVDANISFKNPENNYTQIIFKKELNKYIIITKNLIDNIYIGNNKYKDELVNYGELIFYNGFYFTIIDKYLYIYFGRNQVTILRNIEEIVEEEMVDYESLVNTSNNYNNEEETFKRVPKIQRKIEKKVFTIDAPSPQELKESMPIIYTMLPMLLMSMTSIVSSANVINNITLGEKTVEESLPSLIVAGCMILAMILYPLISHLYRKHRESKREIKRIEEYKDYIYEQKRKIQEEINFQKNILLDTYYDTKKAKEIIESKSNLLWERKRGIEDFLTFSLGNGNIRPNIELKIPEEHFTIDKDKLRIQLDKLEESVELIKDVPITFDFQSNNVVSFIGKKEIINNYVDNLLIRIFSSCSYYDTKIIIFTNNESISNWNKYKNLPYIWSDDKSIRFFANDDISYSKIINYLDTEYNERNSYIKDHKNEQMIFSNYIIIIDDITKTKNMPIISEIIKSDSNLGFTLLFNSEKMDLLPSECKNFVYIEKDKGKLISNVNRNYLEVEFIPDIYKDDYTKCYQNLSNINLDSYDRKFILPSKYSFLEMYNANNIESLDILGRWNNTSTVNSLSVPIGIDENGEIFELNIHENSHGPHGLVAGMTGSGKSELLITYILSLAVNYNPNEVQFVLIDYKGGGLANTFFNSSIGMNLPHVVGVITNIDENEINRSLISLKSEIKRRQKLFAEVGIKYNEGNMDIYKYENIYKNNPDVECLSHLFIISDEFAELKVQNPEFISELISIARIGRSLGIHLILATQKPSGVVDDQIWSNSRFKICLKVQDKSDSNDMIKVPNAATIKDPGRFYIQVGYNELFIKAQSAYSGSEYIEKNSNNKVTAIDFLNNYGKIYMSESLIQNEICVSKGKEINNIVKQIIDISNENNYQVKGLWRELIPEKIYYDQLIQRYKIDKTKYLKCLIGEYDAPDQQKKGPATIELLKDGNTIVYGLVDSGQELVLQVIIYDLIQKYSPSELNLYALDFGTESLINYKSAPQVGDVMIINDQEKIKNTFKYIDKLIDERKKALNKYNSSFIAYNDSNEDKLPAIVVVINILENLFENYEDLQEDFLQITRECNRYGIAFIVTTNGINNVRSKLLQGFKNTIALNLRDKYDYSNLFGTKTIVYPSNAYGRGLIKLENIYEYQTAQLSSEVDNQTAIEQACEVLSKQYDTKATSIPVLPEIISQSIMEKHLINNSNLPIGIDVNTLSVKNFEFKDKKGIIITGLEIDLLLDFYQSLEKNILKFNNNKVYVFSSSKKYKNYNNINNIINSNYGKYLEQLKDYMEISDRKYLNYICFIGIADIYNSLNMEMKKEFNLILKDINNREDFTAVFIESSSSLKKLEFEEFYRNNINNLRGIWIGNGISEQMVIKLSRIPREYRDLVSNKFGFVIDNSTISKVKVIDYIGGKDE